MNRILRCPECGSYGLKKECSCKSERISNKPPKYSPEDKYGSYRRTVKYGK
ncbi:MAG: RNA-protein complex protein Nop10 [Nanoarchaeota archaeon]|nr:RNA-protein complex protein Nop10 [Nanoarchaeota archaeon]MBU1269056.1 RNA-protein complex protein Nop10 [Nanoarchaeota archaeon]MBU1604951.1 RNA-protein complex protein Nop10 [Nanoarchaeota archaeon]MBU2443319.1 RNA-protein complex protein Nop10 [Nanoarchaeota archaeon]